MEYRYRSALLIDDSLADNRINTEIIRSCRLAKEIIVMENPVTALQYLKRCFKSLKNIPDLLFIDINMPEMNGFDLIDEILNFSGVLRGGFKIIIVSSSMDPEDIKLANASGFVQMFIQKPLTPEVLLKIKNSV
ncbi:response regulator [Rubrolithibacter danxiaensis]|uniref:response regulator n=1 Tax=Rubrolithibacter danxiaensis TaxID=3390805 RepID=UPI003BF8DB53